MTILWSYETPAGELVDLSGATGVDELGLEGAFMPPFEFTADEVPDGDGEVVRRVRARARQIAVPVAVQDPDKDGDALHDRLRQLARDLDPTAGAGRLIATRPNRPDESPRYVAALYAGGMELKRTWGDEYGGWWQLCGLLFRCPDPYYSLAEPQQEVWQFEPPPAFFPILPLRVAADSLFGRRTVVNDGSGPAYPVWTVAGPVPGVTFVNHTTGLFFSVEAALAEGEAFVVDTRPGRRTVLRVDGVSLYPQLVGDLWTLAGGENDVEIVVPAGATPESYVNLTYSPRYLTP